MRASISFVPLSRRAAVLMLVLFLAAVSHAQITPSQDSYTNSASPATNYGVAVTLGVVNSAASIQTTYIQFDLSSIPAGYKSSNLSKATLKLYVNAVTTAGSFNIDFVNGTWTEKKVTSSLAPALGTTIMSSVPLTSANGKNYLLLDITSAVGAWLDGTQANDGIALVANSPLSATFDSKENTLQSQPPEIDIVFAGGGTITGVTTASGSGLIGGGSSGTLNLSLTNACAANQILQWNGTAWVCANMGGGGGGGTVTSVGLTAPSTDFLVTGSPVTASGMLGLGWLVAPDFNNTPNAIVKRDSSGNFSAGTINATGGFNLGGAAIAFGSYPNQNAFLGFAGNATMTGNYNAATGWTALQANTTGSGNTATGAQALFNNTTGSWNTASGDGALVQNTTGSDNTATGGSALGVNTTGNYNTASGFEALTSNTAGSINTASGVKALLSNTTGNQNTGIGFQALYYNTGGSNNTALGYNAGPDQNSPSLTNATAIGANTVVSASNALVLGGTGSNAVSVGIGTATPAYTLDVQGTGNFTGLVKFASGQTFPGAGTIKGVTTAAGSGLTGGGTSGTLNLSLVKNCTSGQVLAWNGTAWACTTPSGGGTITGVTAGTDLTGGGTSGNVTLNLDTTKVPQLGTANTFTGNQTVNGNLSATGTVTGSSFNIGSNLFAWGTYSLQNAFFGFSGNATTTGSGNMASGYLALAANTTGYLNTATGYLALNPNTTGAFNTASGANALSANTTGQGNTASGGYALAANTTGSDNTAVGLNALFSNTTGIQNTAVGYQALNKNTASGNSAVGFQSLLQNTLGTGNSAYGYQTLYSNMGSSNTATGYQALYSNTTGTANTASGYRALYFNLGDANTASGYQALYSNTTGTGNTASGASSLISNTTGYQNTASGTSALLNNTTGYDNTAVGNSALWTNQAGSELTCIGYFCTASAPSLSNATAIGAHAVVGASNSLVLGGTGQYAVKVGIGTTTPSNILTIAQGAGHPVSDSWETFSSRRWKTNIHTLHGALGKVEQLRGVSYDLKATGQHEVGVIAEEVGAVVPEVVTWEKNGKDAQSVDYGRLTALLIEATKEQQALIQKQQEQIKVQQDQIVRLTRQVKTIQATLKANERSDSAVRTVKAEGTTVRQ